MRLVAELMEDQFPAGIVSRLQSRGEDLVDAAHDPVRLWGVGFRVLQTMPPKDGDETRAIVKRLRALGVNYLRIMGLDFDDPGILREWLDTGRINAEHMNRLCSFLDILRESGIYYSLSVNHDRTKLRHLQLPQVLQGAAEQRSYRYGQFIYEDVRRVVEAWFKDLVSYREGSCMGFSADPALVHLDIINEESLWGAVQRGEPFTDAALERLARNLDDAGNSIPVSAKELTRPSARLLEAIFQEELHFARQMRNAIRQAGYTGMLSYTNKWYGFGTLALNAAIGDLIEVHAYFDHPNEVRSTAHGVTYSYRGKSYVSDVPWNSLLKDNFESSNAIRKTAIQLIADIPVLVTEWNHAAISPFAYEGIALLPVFAAQQGIAGLAAHTMFPRQGGVYGRDPFALTANPAFLALSPSLSLAYRKGYIRPLQEYPCERHEGGEKRFHQRAHAAGLRNVPFDENSKLVDYGRVRQRTHFDDAQNVLVRCVRVAASESVAAGKPAVEYNRGLLRVDEELFALFVGEARQAILNVNGASVTYSGSGAMSVVSLDGRPLESSRHMLLSVAGSATMPNVCTAEERRFGRSGTSTLCTGDEKVPMKMAIPEIMVSPGGTSCSVIGLGSDADVDWGVAGSRRINTAWSLISC